MDLIYVVVGTLIVFGIPVEAAFEIVHKANMAKEPHPDGEFGKPIKPADWQSPDVEMLALMKEGREYRLALEQQTAEENARAAAVTQSYADAENKLLDTQLKQPEVAVVVPLDQAPVPTVVVETPVVATTSTTESPAPVDTPTSASDASAVPPSTDSAPAVS